MIEATKDYASLLLDEKGHVKSWNKAAKKIKGYNKGEIAGKHFSVFYTPDDQEKQLPKKVLEQANKKGFAVYEGLLARKDGSTYRGEIVITALYDDDETFTGYSVITGDLTEQHQRTELEQHNLDALINNTEDQMWSMDRDYKLITYNKAFDEAITRLTGKQVSKGNDVLDLGFNKKNTKKYKRLYDRVFTGAHFKEIEYTKGPNENWTEISFYPIRKDDAVIGATCYTNDITERKKAERTMEQSEHRFRSLIEHSTDAFVIMSAELKSQYISPSLSKVMGFDDGEGLDMDIFPLVHYDDAPEMLTIFKHVMENPGLPMSFVCQVKHKSGKWRWMEGTLTNLLHDPAINGILNNFRDITERRLAEEKRVRANQLYAFISQVNQTIVHVHDEATLFTRVCNIALQMGKFKAAWIAKTNQENRTIKLAEHSGLSDETASLFHNLPYRKGGPTDQVLQTGNYYLCNNIATETDPPAWGTIIPQDEYRSFMIFPIKTGNKITGTFNLHSEEVGFFNTSDILLLKEVAGDISFALTVFEKDKAKAKAERRLAHSEFRLNQAQVIAGLGSWEIDFATGSSIWSEEACNIYGLENQENEHSLRLWLSFVHPNDLGMITNIIKDTAVRHNNTSFYHRIVRRDGTIRYIYTQSHFEFNEKGEPTGLYGIAHDVTEKRENLMKLREQNKQLGEIAWIQSHKVRGPLATILGLSKLFKEYMPEVEQDEIMDGIINSAEQLDEVIKEIVNNTVVANINMTPAEI